MNHAELSAAVRKRLPAYARLFPNATGLAKQGERYVRHGLAVGSADLIGWVTETIEESRDFCHKRDRQVAHFLAVELKRPKERAKPAQLNFLRAVAAAGGYAMIIRDAAEVDYVFHKARPAIKAGKVYGEEPSEIAGMRFYLHSNECALYLKSYNPKTNTAKWAHEQDCTNKLRGAAKLTAAEAYAHPLYKRGVVEAIPHAWEWIGGDR